jgi:hypothetical protein
MEMATMRKIIYVTKGAYDCQVPARLFGSSVEKVEVIGRILGRKMHPGFLMTLCSGQVYYQYCSFSQVYCTYLSETVSGHFLTIL